MLEYKVDRMVGVDINGYIVDDISNPGIKPIFIMYIYSSPPSPPDNVFGGRMIATDGARFWGLRYSNLFSGRMKTFIAEAPFDVEIDACKIKSAIKKYLGKHEWIQK